MRLNQVGYNVRQRDFVGDEDTTRDTRIIMCSSLEDFKNKMQEITTRYHNKGDNTWQLEAPQINESMFEPDHDGIKDIEVLHYTEFCDTDPILIWKEQVCDFSRWNKLRAQFKK